MDRREFRRRLALRLAVHPVTLLPTLGGATALLFGWAIGAPLVVFGGIAGLAVAIGALATRAGILGEQIARGLHEELQEKAHEASEAALDALRERLASDHDTRDERMLDQLREISAAFKRDTGWAARVNPVSAAEISSGVEELVRTCVKKLQDAFTLLQTARDLTNSPVRAAVMQQRELVLEEVAASIAELTEFLTGVYTLGMKGDAGAETVQVRDRLRQSLDVARKVEEAMDPHAEIRERIRERARKTTT